MPNRIVSYFFVPMADSKKITFGHLASILRLSTKYDIKTLRWKCIQELGSIYPRTLKEFDASEYRDLRRDDDTSIDEQLSSALVLFQECALELLPVLFYLITRGSLSKTLERLETLPKSEPIGYILLGRESLLNTMMADVSPFVYRPKASK